MVATTSIVRFELLVGPPPITNVPVAVPVASVAAVGFTMVTPASVVVKLTVWFATAALPAFLTTATRGIDEPVADDTVEVVPAPTEIEPPVVGLGAPPEGVVTGAEPPVAPLSLQPLEASMIEAAAMAANARTSHRDFTDPC